MTDNNQHFEDEREVIRIDWKQNKLEPIMPALDFKYERMFVGVPLIYGYSPFGRDNDVKENEGTFLITSNGEYLSCRPEELAKKNLRITGGGMLPQRFSVEGVRKFINGEVKEINSVKLFENIRNTSALYLDFEDPRINSLVSVWIMGTYIFPLFYYYPYLSIEGEKATGKSKTLRFISQLAFNAEIELTPTEAGIFRTPSETRGTALFDEAEKVGKNAKDAILQVLRAGFMNSGNVKRLRKAQNKGGERQVLERLPVYSPKVFASIWKRDDFTERCISIIMSRTRNRTISGKHIEEKNPDWQEFRDYIYYWALLNWKAVSDMYNILEVPDLEGRPLDLWKPLLAIAKVLNESICSDLLELAVEIEKERQEENKGLPYYEGIKGLGLLVSGLNLKAVYSTEDIWDVWEKNCPDMYSWEEAGKDPRKKQGIKIMIGNLLKNLKIKSTRNRRGLNYVITPEIVAALKEKYGVVENE